MNTFALSAGAAATKTLSSIEIRKVLIFAVQKGLQVNLKKINRIRFGYNFGKNWFSKSVLLIQPHFFLSEIVILFKVGIFELEIVHLFDHLDSLVQGVRNGVEFGIFVYSLVFLLRNRFGLKVGLFSYDLKRLGLDHWFEVLLVGTFSGVVLESSSIDVESVLDSWLNDGFVFWFLLSLHYKNEYYTKILKFLPKNDGECFLFEFPLK